MVKYRKKPIVVNAEQWFPRNKQWPGLGLPDSLGVMWQFDEQGNIWQGTIETLEGPHIVSIGDWIITGVKGEKYPCKPDIFEATYEPVSALNAQPCQKESGELAKELLSLFDDLHSSIYQNEGNTPYCEGHRDGCESAAWRIEKLLPKAAQVEARIEELEKALRKHKHTDECLAYAAKTAKASGIYHCIAECADSHKAALSEEVKDDS
uniref:Uncharacterized protein n=1 Tax=viral metagenome TaxID=1070528 RepID=A0A6M3LGX0_9ZZZZ